MSQPVTKAVTESATEIFAQPLAASVLFPPGDLDSDEPPWESDRHRQQIDLLIRLIKAYWHDRPNFYATGNLTVY